MSRWLSDKLKDQRTNWKYILIVVILASIVGGGILGYQWRLAKEVSLTKFPEIKKLEITIEDKIADWSTYRNEEYGFEIKYPNDWLVYVLVDKEWISFVSKNWVLKFCKMFEKPSLIRHPIEEERIDVVVHHEPAEVQELIAWLKEQKVAGLTKEIEVGVEKYRGEEFYSHGAINGERDLRIIFYSMGSLCIV